MLRNTTRNLLLATCIAAVPSIALAQTQTQAPQRAQQNQTAASSAQMAGKFLAAPMAGQIRAADLRSADIYTADNQKVGDIDDILLDSRGNIVAVVVGVGGFLGIGQKNVAIPFESLNMMDTNSGMAANTGTTTMGTANNAPANSAAANRDRMATGNVPAAPGATDQDRQRATAQQAETMSQQQANQQRGTTTATPANPRMAQNTDGVWKPERILLQGVTKAELESAPAFSWDASATSANSNTTNAPSRNR